CARGCSRAVCFDFW
nr:immunoglobulin heavy chain junction region [Macaca mulatta]